MTLVRRLHPKTYLVLFIERIAPTKLVSWVHLVLVTHIARVSILVHAEAIA